MGILFTGGQQSRDFVFICNHLFIYLFKNISHFYFFIVDTTRDVPLSPPYTPTKPLPIYPWPFTTLLSVSMGFAYTRICSLANLFQSSQPLFSEICPSVPCIHASGFILFIIYSVHYIPHMSEIIWYLSFAVWLILLSVIFSRSIQAVSKGKSSFFFTAAWHSIV